MRPHSIRSLLGIAAVLVAAVVVALAFGVSTHSPTAQAQAAGDDPRLINITNLDQLNAIRWDPDGDGTVLDVNQTLYEDAFGLEAGGSKCEDADGCTGYELMTDLDFEGSDYATGTGWIPIEEFDAVFDGNGHTISNLFIDMDIHGSGDVGFIGRLAANAVVKDLNLTDIDVTVTNVAEPNPDSGVLEVGGLAASSTGAVESSYVSGDISVVNTQRFVYVGGLLGRTSGTTTGSGAAVAVNVQTPSRAIAGGLIGIADAEVDGLIVRDSYATGDVMVSADNFVVAGGLIGSTGLAGSNRGTITGSYATGNATVMAAGGVGVAEAGGLAGLTLGDIVASYATGDATVIASPGITQIYVGGLVAVTDSNIVASYATGDATAINNGDGSEFAGGLVGVFSTEFSRPPRCQNHSSRQLFDRQCPCNRDWAECRCRWTGGLRWHLHRPA